MAHFEARLDVGGIGGGGGSGGGRRRIVNDEALPIDPASSEPTIGDVVRAGNEDVGSSHPGAIGRTDAFGGFGGSSRGPGGFGGGGGSAAASSAQQHAAAAAAPVAAVLSVPTPTAYAEVVAWRRESQRRLAALEAGQAAIAAVVGTAAATSDASWLPPPPPAAASAVTSAAATARPSGAGAEEEMMENRAEGRTVPERTLVSAIAELRHRTGELEGALRATERRAIAEAQRLAENAATAAAAQLREESAPVAARLKKESATAAAAAEAAAKALAAAEEGRRLAQEAIELSDQTRDRQERTDTVAKSLAIKSLKYAREQRQHVMAAVSALENRLQRHLVLAPSTADTAAAPARSSCGSGGAAGERGHESPDEDERHGDGGDDGGGRYGGGGNGGGDNGGDGGGGGGNSCRTDTPPAERTPADALQQEVADRVGRLDERVEELANAVGQLLDAGGRPARRNDTKSAGAALSSTASSLETSPLVTAAAVAACGAAGPATGGASPPEVAPARLARLMELCENGRLQLQRRLDEAAILQTRLVAAAQACGIPLVPSPAAVVNVAATAKPAKPTKSTAEPGGGQVRHHALLTASETVARRGALLALRTILQAREERGGGDEDGGGGGGGRSAGEADGVTSGRRRRKNDLRREIRRASAILGTLASADRRSGNRGARGGAGTLRSRETASPEASDSDDSDRDENDGDGRGCYSGGGGIEKRPEWLPAGVVPGRIGDRSLRLPRPEEEEVDGEEGGFSPLRAAAFVRARSGVRSGGARGRASGDSFRSRSRAPAWRPVPCAA
ncbi:unnamed protein product [Phaeothamnion confervicola]